MNTARISLGRIILKKIRSNHTDIICLASVIAVSAVWGFLTFNKTAPAQEGWYVVYGNMILDGMVPYLDFEFLYPPLYAYISALIVATFGNSLLAFRVLGVLLLISIAIVSFFILKSILPSWIAATGSSMMILAFQGDVFFISYDYHSFFTLFSLLSVYFMLKALLLKYDEEEGNTDRYLFFSGLMCSVAASIRPQSGVMLFVFFVGSLLILKLFVRKISPSLKDVGYFLLGISIPILVTCILLIFAGAFSACIEMVFFGGTKGSIYNMLTEWIPYLRRYMIYNALLLIPILIYVFARKGGAEINTGRTDHLIYFSTVVVVISFIVSMFFSIELATDASVYNPARYDQSWAPTFFLLECFVVLTLILKIIKDRIKSEETSSYDLGSLFLGGSALVIGFGAATSGPINYLGTALVFGLIFGALLRYSVEHPRTVTKEGIKALSIIFVAFLMITIPASKVVTPYHWWGNSPAPYADAVYDADVDYFRGIKMTASEKNMYEDFEEKANLYLDPSDEMYCYANISIFYTLAGKTPTVRGVVPWFDVSRESTIWEDLDYLKSNNPKLIVFNDHGMNAVDVHENLFGDKSAHRELYSWLLECRDDPGSKYTVASTYYGEYNTYLMVLK